MKRSAIVSVTVLIVAGSLLAQAPSRTVEQVLHSASAPKIDVVIGGSYSYLGHVRETAMEGETEFDQYIFSEVRGERLGRTVIVHFEHVLPGRRLTFNYPHQDMVRLGRNEYLQQSFPAQDWDLFRSPEFKTLLDGRQLSAPPIWLVNRYVRTVGSQRKAEMILFYLEPAGSLPAPASELGLGGSARNLWGPIARDLAVRARAAITVRD